MYPETRRSGVVCTRCRHGHQSEDHCCVYQNEVSLLRIKVSAKVRIKTRTISYWVAASRFSKGLTNKGLEDRLATVVRTGSRHLSISPSTSIWVCHGSVCWQPRDSETTLPSLRSRGSIAWKEVRKPLINRIQQTCHVTPKGSQFTLLVYSS